ncbi:MAG TPA: hypothetical protein VG649_06410 [Candidatus Angelobacter sp.]|nr:hypothetical protein [Candidatus Angelobacter sp.]
MLVDRSHRLWIIVTGIALLIAAIAYGFYSYFALYGPSGGTIPGIIFGVLGYLMMWFAFLLWRRKKSRSQRFKSPQWWMKGHLWVGLLSYPLIFFHGGGLHFGYGLTRILMWAFTLVIVTGVLGAFLQHFMPRLMTQRVAMESIYYNIDEVMEKLGEEAERAIASFRKLSPLANSRPEETQGGGTLAAVASSVSTAATDDDELIQSYDTAIRPYLAKRFVYGHKLCSERTAKEFFTALRSDMALEIVEAVNHLEEICQEKRDLDRQTIMHRVLHGWLLVHVPLSALVIVLGAIHAVMALHYL